MKIKNNKISLQSPYTHLKKKFRRALKCPTEIN